MGHIMRLNLPTKTTVILSALVATAVGGASLSAVYAWRERKRVDCLVSGNVDRTLKAAGLSIVLLKERARLAAWLLEHRNQPLPEKLRRAEWDFRTSLAALRADARAAEDRASLDQLEQALLRCQKLLGSLSGQSETEKEGRIAVSERLLAAYDRAATLCDSIAMTSTQDTRESLRSAEKASNRLALLAGASAATTVVLGGGLLWMLIGSVFLPLRRMAAELRHLPTASDASGDCPQDDLDVLAWSLRLLRSDAMHARCEIVDLSARLTHSKRLAAIGEAVAKLMHETRNRLALLGGYAKLITEHPEDVKLVVESAPVIVRQVRKLERMLHQVSDFSRPASLDMAMLSLNDLARDAVEQVKGSLSSNVMLTEEYGPEMPLVAMDAERIERVVLNLIRNAAESLGEQGSIAVRTFLENDWVVLTVKDNGAGIPPEFRDHIYDPFFTTKKKGTGLGLAICRQVAREHGGHLTLEDSPTVGTVATLAIPCARAKRLGFRRQAVRRSERASECTMTAGN